MNEAARPPASPLCHALTTLAAAVIVATWVRAFVLYPSIPQRFPSHFDAVGNPDGWATRSVASWFMLPAIALAVEALLLSVGWWGRALVVHAPGIVNMPRKELFLRLSPEGRVEAFGPTRAFLAFVVLLVALLFWYLLEGTAAVATGVRATLPSWPIFVFLGLVFASLVPYLVVTSRLVAAIARREGLASSR